MERRHKPRSSWAGSYPTQPSCGGMGQVAQVLWVLLGDTWLVLVGKGPCLYLHGVEQFPGS